MTKPPNVIVGYSNTFHDASIAIISDDNVFAESLERASQSKRAIWSVGLFNNVGPLRKTLRELGYPMDSDVAVTVRTTWNQNLLLRSGSAIFRRLYRRTRDSGGLRSSLVDDSQSMVPIARYAQVWYLQARPIFNYILKTHLWDNRVQDLQEIPTEHHLTHAANGVYTSPFKECAVMVLDGSGEEVGHTFYHYKDNTFRKVYSGHASLGYLYSDITIRCGFSPLHGEEWKVMGLAAYGAPRQEIYDFFAKRTRVDGLRLKLKFGDRAYRELESLIGGFRHREDPEVLKAADLAYNFQAYFADTVAKITENFAAMGLSRNLVYVGGCALNSAANGRLVSESAFENLHIPSAPGDDGNSLGAALYQKHVVHKRDYVPTTASPYLGSPLREDELETVLGFGGIAHERFASDAQLCKRVASLLASGKIVGWMQGRAEFGPRSLGNRSILADPRAKDMKDRINALVKFREGYRPLAPSVLHDHGPSYFEPYQFSPYMERALRFRPEVRESVPAVVHHDGTGRVQSVTSELNSLYYQLISAFHQQTGIPILVNTSLNVMGKPIVHSVADALCLFFSSGLHYLVVGRVLLKKPGNEMAQSELEG